MKPNVLLIGAGNMGGALLTGWEKHQVISAVTVIDPSPDLLLAKRYPVFATIDRLSADQKFDIVLLAVKPQILNTVLSDLVRFAKSGSLFLSIAAGRSIASITSGLGLESAAIIRSMPNMPAMLGMGITVCVANPRVTPVQKTMAETLLHAVGDVLWIADEDMMHAVTAVSGSGPAYVFELIGAMQKAAEALGLAPDLAARLARKTVEGAAALSAASQDKTASDLCRQIISPGGTTEAALKILNKENALNLLFQGALSAAATRSKELAE